MTDTLLQTKLYIPFTRQSLVPRHQLIEKLNTGLNRKLTLICAPAGFGKTTLTTAWLAQLQRPFFWLSIDAEDNDPHRFFTYLGASLSPVLGENSTFAPASNLPAQAITTMLLNSLMQLTDPIVLILDDYHLIETEAIHESLTFLCGHLPPTLNLVLTSRSDPPLPLARMRVRGELNEIREKDLRFTEEETAVFLNQVMGLDLTTQQVAALEKRTEGWIASLQLAALSLQESIDKTELIQAFRGTHRYLVDYLVEEVLAQRPGGTREFLLKTALLNRFSASLCDELLSIDHAQQTLTQLEKANFFLIPLDDQRRWYRYHHLFADVLRQQVWQTYPNEIPDLYQRASQWYKNHDFLYDAIDMALVGNHYEQAAVWILEAAESVIWAHGEWLLLDRWLAGLPESFVKQQARLCLYHAWSCLIRSQPAMCQARLVDAENAINEAPEVDRLARGELAAIRAAIARFQGNQAQVLTQADIALNHLPLEDNNWRVMTLLNLGAAHFLGDDTAAAQETLNKVWQLAQAENQAMLGCLSSSFLAQLQVRNGRYHNAQQIFQQAQAMAQARTESVFNVGMTHIGLGELWLAWNNLEKAEKLLQEGLDIGTTVQNILLILSGSLSLARLRQIQGRFDEANALLLQAQEVAKNPAAAWSWVHVPTAAHLARAWLHQGDLNEARRHLETAIANMTAQPGFWTESVQITQARLWLAEGKWEESESLLAKLWETAVIHQRIRSQVEIQILQAVTQQNLSQIDQAQTNLRDALILAKPSGEIRLFIDEGEPLQWLFSDLKFEDLSLQTYAQQIASSFPDRQSATAAEANQQLVEPLTPRELELLALVVTGISNREIGEQLFISYGTVRRHLNNIYGKLGVNGRSQAILKAQELNLV